MNCKIIRSNRKTLGLEVNAEGLIIRAPLQATDAEINMFILQHKSWIEKHLNKVEEQQKKADAVEPLSIDEIRALADQALKVIPERVKYYAQKIGVIGPFTGAAAIYGNACKFGAQVAAEQINA